MGNLALKVEDLSAPTESFPRKLFYRRHLKWTYYALMGWSLLIGFAVLLKGVLILMISGRVEAALTSVVDNSIVPLILFFEARLVNRPLAFSFVQIFPDRIELNRIGRVIKFNFSAIKKVKFVHIPLLGGGYSIVAEGKRPYYFFISLERSDAILDAIAVARPTLMNQDRLFSYRKLAVLDDHGWARFHQRIRSWPSFVFKYFAFPVSLAAIHLFFLKTQTEMSLIFAPALIFTMNMVLGFVFFALAQILFIRMFNKEFLKSRSYFERDAMAETIIQRKLDIAFYCASIASFVIILVIFNE